jgi:hypothetical protein
MTLDALRIGFTVLTLSLVGCSGEDGDPAADDGKEAGPSSGGSGGSGGSGTSACSDAQEATDPTAFIDDMEDQNASVLMNGNRTGGWWATGDGSSGGTIVPEPGGPALPEVIPGGRCGSQYAMRVTGQGFTDWGALLGVNLAYDSTGGAFYDASAYEGITFWARVGDTSTNVVRVAISDANSEPKGGKCVDGGGAGEGCFDTFGVTISTLGTTWQRYKVPFSGLTQRNYGLQAEALDTKTLFIVGFNVDANTVFDLWVDDVSFY